LIFFNYFKFILYYLNKKVSSNVIVVIAVDRLLTVVSAAHRQPAVANRRMHLMLGVAWFSSLAIACPQFIVWRTYVAFREPVPWSQCLQVFVVF
jgi:hypothetical protein